MIPLNNNISFLNNKLVPFWYPPEDVSFRPSLHFHDNSLISFSKVGDGFSFFNTLNENKAGIFFHVKRERAVELSRFGIYLSFGLERFIKIKSLISKLFSLFILYFSSISRKIPIFFFKRRKYLDLYNKQTSRTIHLYNKLYKKKKKFLNKKLVEKGVIPYNVHQKLKNSYSYGEIKSKIMYFFFKKKLHYFIKNIIFNQKKLIFYSLYKKYELFFFFYIKKIFYHFFIKKIYKYKCYFKNNNLFLFFFNKLFLKIKNFIFFFRNKYLKKFIFNIIKKYIFSKYYNYLNITLFNKIEFNNFRFFNNSFFNNLFLLFNNYFFNFFKEKSISYFNNNVEKNTFLLNHKYKNEHDFYFSASKFNKGLNEFGISYSRHRYYFSYIERRLQIFRSFFISFFNYFLQNRDQEFINDLYETIYCGFSPFSYSVENLYTSDVQKQLLNYCVEISCKSHPFFTPFNSFNKQILNEGNNKQNIIHLDSILRKKYIYNDTLLKDNFIKPIGIPEFVARLKYSNNKKHKDIYYKHLFQYIGKEYNFPLKTLPKESDHWFFIKKKPILLNKFTKNYVGYKNFFDIGFNLSVQLRKYPEKWIHTKYIFKKHKNKGKRKERYKTIPSSFFVENAVHNYIIPFNTLIKKRFFLTTRQLYSFFRKIKYNFLHPLSSFILFFFCFNNRLDCFIHKLFPFSHIKDVRSYITKGIIFINGNEIKDPSFLINTYDFISFNFGWNLKKKKTFFFFGQQYFILLFYFIFTLGKHLLRSFLKNFFFKIIFNVIYNNILIENQLCLNLLNKFKYITFNNLYLHNTELIINRFHEYDYDYNYNLILKLNQKKKENEASYFLKKLRSPLIGLENKKDTIDNLLLDLSFEYFFFNFYYVYVQTSFFKEFNLFFFQKIPFFFPFIKKKSFFISSFISSFFCKTDKINPLEKQSFSLKKKKKDLIYLFSIFFKFKINFKLFFFKKINFFIRFFSFFFPNFFLNDFFYNSSFFFSFCNSCSIFDFFLFFFFKKKNKNINNKKEKQISFLLEKRLIYFSFLFLLNKLYFFLYQNKFKYKLFIKKKIKFINNIESLIPHLKSYFYSLYWYYSLIEDLSLFSFKIKISIRHELINYSDFFFYYNISLCYKIFFSFFERIINSSYFFSFQFEGLVSSYFLLSWDSVFSFSFKSFNFDLFFTAFQNYLPEISFFYISNLKNYIIIKNYKQLPSYIRFKRINGIPRTIYGRLEFFKRTIQNHMMSKKMKHNHLYHYVSRNVTPDIFEVTPYGQPYYYGSAA